MQSNKGPNNCNAVRWVALGKMICRDSYQKTKKNTTPQEQLTYRFISSATFILGGERLFRFASHRLFVGGCATRRIRGRNAQSIIVTRLAAMWL